MWLSCTVLLNAYRGHWVITRDIVRYPLHSRTAEVLGRHLCIMWPHVFRGPFVGGRVSPTIVFFYLSEILVVWSTGYCYYRLDASRFIPKSGLCAPFGIYVQVFLNQIHCRLPCRFMRNNKYTTRVLRSILKTKLFIRNGSQRRRIEKNTHTHTHTPTVSTFSYNNITRYPYVSSSRII